MLPLALGLLLLVGLLLTARLVAHASTAALAQAVRIAGVGLAVLALIAVVLTREPALLSLVLGGLLPMFMRWRRRARAMAGPAPAGTSEVEGRHVRMTLDLASGAMRGVVLDGAHRGQRLDDLAPEALVGLLRDWRLDDAASADLLEAYLDRAHPDWRQADTADDPQAEAAAGPARGPMSRAEALRILDLEEGCTPDAIREAHHRLMRANHPDRGGSTYLAAKINEARALLMGN